METTDYVLSIIEAHPAIVGIFLSQEAFQTFLKDKITPGISIQEWSEDWCEGRNESGEVLVRFKP